MRDRIYTYSELKERIQKDYETFNFIIESKHIFNQEFIGFRKFFKNLLKKESKKKNERFDEFKPVTENNFKFHILRPYFESVITEYRIYFHKEVVPDLSMAQLHKDFPNLKADYDLLLSLKDKVRSGKRPKDLEKDYEAERLRKAALEDKATCGICHGYWELVDMDGKQNIIADHGFNIAFGYRSGTCFGARFKSWEKSPESKIEYVKQILKPTLKEVLDSKPSQGTVDALIKMVERYKVNLDDYYKLSFDIRRNTEAPKSPEYLLPGQQIGYSLSKINNINLSLITEVWVEYKSRLENEIARFEKQITEWVLKPTPKERMNNEKAKQ